jgi:hypothetical protein
VRVRVGQVGVIAIRPVAELELEHLAGGLQCFKRLLDSGGAHHRVVFEHSLEELLRAGVLATLHQRAQDGVNAAESADTRPPPAGRRLPCTRRATTLLCGE